jgi:NodT family efflux transporter outer membrane factor (OMF) lipoprotein
MRIARPSRAVAVLAALLLGACATTPDFERPAPPRAERYTSQRLAIEGGGTAGEPGQQVVLGKTLERDWWRLFGSEAIDGVVKRALAGNRTLAAAASTLAQAQALAAARAGAAAPQIGMTAGTGRQKYGAQFLGPLTKPPPFNYFAVGPTVSYTLDYAGGLARSVEQQYAVADFQREQLAAAYLAVTGNAVMRSIEIASLRAQIAAVEKILEEDRENVKLVNEAFAAGSVSRLDVLAAASQLAGDGTLLPPLRQQLAVARHALAIVLGEPPAHAALPDFELSQLTLPRELPLTLPSELAHRRPDILAAEARLHAATAAVGIAKANLYPHVTLSATAGLQATDPAHLFDSASGVWSLIGSLVAPIIDGGSLRAEHRAAVDAMRAAAASYQQTVLVAFGQVADALQGLEHDAQQLEAQGRARDAARENLDLARKSYNEGNVGVLQVLDAERLYQRARLGYVQARAQRHLDTVQLFLALGGSAPEAVSEQAVSLSAPAR